MSVGTEIAGYRIEELIGRGGMGVVYRAHDLALERNVALKLLAPELAEDERFRERFLASRGSPPRSTTRTSSPSTTPARSRASCTRHALRRGLRPAGAAPREGRSSPARAIAICLPDRRRPRRRPRARARPPRRQALERPARSDEREHVYLADFGLTRRLSDQAPAFDAGLSLGTPAYVAPEQIEGKEVDGRADLYSLGCLLHECLTGEPPFPRGSEAAVLFAHLEEHAAGAARPRARDETALAKSPDDRYATCAEFVADARRALGLEPKRSRWPLAVAGVGAALLGAALLAFFLTRGDGRSTNHRARRAPLPDRPGREPGRRLSARR